MLKCCMTPGRSQNRTSTNLTSFFLMYVQDFFGVLEHQSSMTAELASPRAGWAVQRHGKGWLPVGVASVSLVLRMFRPVRAQIGQDSTETQIRLTAIIERRRVSVGAGHDHGTVSAAYRSRLLAVLVITVGVVALQVVAGLVSGSLALLADAGHALTDATGFALALGASWLAGRPADTGTNLRHAARGGARCPGQCAPADGRGGLGGH